MPPVSSALMIENPSIYGIFLDKVDSLAPELTLIRVSIYHLLVVDG